MNSDELNGEKLAIIEAFRKEEEDRERRIAFRKFSHPDFNKNFRFTDRHKPEKGDIIARFGAIAEIVGGADKNDLIDLCLQPDSAHAAAAMMQKIFCAAEWDCWGVPRQITEDLVNGMTEEEIKKKVYPYAMEMIFYTKPELMPQGDEPDSKYWSMIEIVNLKDYLTIEAIDEDGNIIKCGNQTGLQENSSQTDTGNNGSDGESVVEIHE